jgi:hypothetical protein
MVYDWFAINPLKDLPCGQLIQFYNLKGNLLKLLKICTNWTIDK